MANLIEPASILGKAIKAVPAVKYALGVAGIAAVIAIIVGAWKIDYRVAIVGVIIMLIFMVILRIFAVVTTTGAALPATVFLWFCLVIFIAAVTCLFTSVFWDYPVPLKSRVFAASPQSIFSLTVTAHGENQPKITAGTVTIDCEGFRGTQKFTENGKANFELPQRCWDNDTTRLLPEIAGFCSEWQPVRIKKSAVELPLKSCLPHLRGIIIPTPKRPTDLRIVIDDGREQATVNADGTFDVPVVTETGSVHLQVFVRGRPQYDRYKSVPGNVAINVR